jgi:hypothetical protein
MLISTPSQNCHFFIGIDCTKGNVGKFADCRLEVRESKVKVCSAIMIWIELIEKEFP